MPAHDTQTHTQPPERRARQVKHFPERMTYTITATGERLPFYIGQSQIYSVRQQQHLHGRVQSTRAILAKLAASGQKPVFSTVAMGRTYSARRAAELLLIAIAVTNGAQLVNPTDDLSFAASLWPAGPPEDFASALAYTRKAHSVALKAGRAALRNSEAVQWVQGIPYPQFCTFPKD